MTREFARFLQLHLPALSTDWWRNCVYSQLSFQQQRLACERGIEGDVAQLDLAALLRVFDKNWFELAHKLNFPSDGRSWLKELQSVRNRWAHQSLEEVSGDDRYRDYDTLGRILRLIDADQALLAAVDSKKQSCIRESHASDQKVSQIVETVEVVPDRLFKVGQLVELKSDPDKLAPILEVIPGEPETRYTIFQSNRKLTVYESQLKQPQQDMDSTAQLAVADFHAHMTALMLRSPTSTNLVSLRAGRVQFVPYQYRPVLRLIRADRPRLLIADEVGVGKTIEAGLIIHELRARMDLTKVLVLCPKSLVAERKWQVEMKRFDENFVHLDGPMLRECMQETDVEGEWPAQYAKVIVPFSLFDSELLFGAGGKSRRKNGGLLALDPPPKFDLVIVDEAHHIRNSENYLHQGVRYFCDNAEAVIFLTATPIQLGSDDLFTLLNVLRPDLIIDRSSFEQMAEPNRFINEAVRHCRQAKPDWQLQAQERLAHVAQTSWGSMFLRESPIFQAVYDQLGERCIDDAKRIALTRQIEGMYTFSSIINRTRRRDIGDFTTRKPETIRIPFTSSQAHLHDTLLDVLQDILAHTHGQQNVKFMMTTVRRQASSCIFGLTPLLRGMLDGKLELLETQEASDTESDVTSSFSQEVRASIEALLEVARGIAMDDPKLEAFLKKVREKGQMSNNKALVFTTFRHTLTYLAKSLTAEGVRYGLVHGQIADEERAHLRRCFGLSKENPDALDVLLSSEVGCEGLDFQFCDMIINYDLPWNPMRVEQRIGRIDRYGQKSQAVAIVNLITPGTVDAEIYDRCLWRIGVFQHAIGGCEEILGQVTEEIHHVAESFALSADEQARRLQQLSDNAILRLQEDEALEAREAELFGLNPKSQRTEEETETSAPFWLTSLSLARCVVAYLENRLEQEGEYLLGEKPTKTLRLSQHARTVLLSDYRQLPKNNDPAARAWEKWLKGTQPTLPITFDQETAADDSKVVHLTVLHPLIRQAAATLASRGFVELTVKAITQEVPRGGYPFAIYRWEKTGTRLEEEFVAIAVHPIIQQKLLSILPMTTDGGEAIHASQEARATLEAAHHKKWVEARAQQRNGTEELVQHRMHSLRVSHQARKNLLCDRIAAATNPNIRLMKESELSRAETDYQQRMAALMPSIEQADIRSEIVVLGTLTVTPE